MYSSSDMPNLQRKCSRIGSNGRLSFGIRQLSCALSTTAALYIDTIPVIPEYMFVNRAMMLSTTGLNRGGAMVLRSHTGNVCAVVVIVFTAAPNGIMGRLHPDCEGSADVRLLIDVPGSVMSGSLNSRAVAGTLLGTINPEFTPIAVLNTEIRQSRGQW